MRVIFFLMIILFAVVARAQNEKPPTTAEMQAQMQQSLQKAKQRIAEKKQQIAEARINKDAPETIIQMEKQLESLQQMVSMLEKTNITGNKIPKGLPPAKNTEPAYVSPFTPITLKQPVKAPTWEQATDNLLWYRGKRIDANTLITPSGLIVRFNRQTNMLTLHPVVSDTIYFGLVKTLSQIKQIKNDYTKRMDGMMNSFFMFPQIEDAYKEFDQFNTRFYNLAKNSRQLQQPSSAQYLEFLQRMVTELADYIRNLPALNIIQPPKRPNDLCICEDDGVKTKYEKDLNLWVINLFAEEIKITEMIELIARQIDFTLQNGISIPANAQSVTDNVHQYLIIVLERLTAKLRDVANQYEQGDALIEDGMVQAWYQLLRLMSEWDQQKSPEYSVTRSGVVSALSRIRNLVESDIFEKYIEKQKIEKNYNTVFDYGLYTSHEMNKKLVDFKSSVNNDLYAKWMEGLKKFNRFELTIDIDFKYQQVSKPENDRILMWATGILETDNKFYVSLGRKDCHWILYPTDVDHRNRNTAGEEFKIPVKITEGKKDYVDDKSAEFLYTGPAYMRMIFPTFKINLCGDESTVMIDQLSYTPAELQRHKNDEAAKKYSIDMLAYANKMFVVAKKTEMNVNELIRTSGEMMNVHSSQMPQSSGDPAFDQMRMDYLMNKKRHDLQYSVSQIAHTGKTVINLTRSSAIRDIFIRANKDLADPTDEDKKYGMMLTKGIVSIKAVHAPYPR